MDSIGKSSRAPNLGYFVRFFLLRIKKLPMARTMMNSVTMNAQTLVAREVAVIT